MDDGIRRRDDTDALESRHGSPSATHLIACPCALVISTPAAIASGLAAAARQGLLIKCGAALETLGKVRTVAFDKTGTLTRGSPQVTDVIAIAGGEDTILAKAAAVERHTSHPLGLAITEPARSRRLEVPLSFGGGIATPGKAVTARLKGASPRSARHASPPSRRASVLGPPRGSPPSKARVRRWSFSSPARRSKG